MHALCLGEVNRKRCAFREMEADEDVAEDGCGGLDGLVQRGIVIAHERSPWETTHDDLRWAVEAPSGGSYRPGIPPCLLTIYAAMFESVRPGFRETPVRNHLILHLSMP